MKLLQIQCSAPTKKVAKKIAKTLVDTHLSACVQIIPKLHSFYIYKGEFCEDEEFLLLIKSDVAHFKAVEKCILDLHPYELPEIMSLPVVKSSKAYEQWVKEALV